MSNVSFLRGLHASLPANGSAINGAFYLTTDSHRLYVGDENKNLIDLNKYIITVAKLADLNAADGQVGDFYYAEAENALVLRKADGWHLINKDTNNRISSATGAYVVSAESDVATIEYEYKVLDDGNKSVGAKDSFTIKAGDNINLTASGKEITIDGAKYSFSVNTDTENQAVFKLTNDHDSTSTSATIKAGSNVTISKDANGNVVIASDYVDTYVTSAETKLNDDGTISFVLTRNDNKTVVSSKSGIISYDVGGTSYLPGSELPVYTKDEIETKLKGLNGMTYKGTVGVGGTVSALPSSNVASGDTYLVVGSNGVEYGGGTAKQGDLLIATGSEGTNGFLSSVTWTYVPSGDDAEHDTTYKFTVDAANNTVKLTTTDGQTITGTHKVDATGALSVSSTGSGSNLTTTITHNKIPSFDPATNSVENATTITAVTGVSVDDYGHVIGYTVAESALMSYTLDGSNSVANGAATFSTSLKNSLGGVVATKSHEISSTSLTIASTTNGASIDMTWGSF